MSILVTGGAGFVGSHLVERLLRDGEEVRVVDDLSSGSLENLSAVRDHPGFSFHQDTVLDRHALERSARGVRWIFHLAAVVGVDRAVREPVETLTSLVHGVESVLECARTVGAGVVFTSSSEVYGRGAGVPFREDDDLVLGSPARIRWGYGACKAIGEHLCNAYHRDHGVPLVVTRLFNTIGPRQTGRYGMVLPRFLEQAASGSPVTVYGDGRQRRCFTDVRDTVESLVRLYRTRAAIGATFNIGNDREIRIVDLARRVVRRSGDRSPIVHLPYERVFPAGFDDVRRRVPCVERLERTVGFRPRRGLDETLDWLVESASGRLTAGRPAPDALAAAASRR
jgi:UDP-glucose 4-epimerase